MVKFQSPRFLPMKQKMFGSSLPIFMLLVYFSVEDKISQKMVLLCFWHNGPSLINSPFFFAVGSFELRSLLAFPMGSQQRPWVRQARACWETLEPCQRFRSPCASGVTMLINLHFLPQAPIPFVLTVASCRICFTGLQPASCPGRLRKVLQTTQQNGTLSTLPRQLRMTIHCRRDW